MPRQSHVRVPGGRPAKLTLGRADLSGQETADEPQPDDLLNAIQALSQLTYDPRPEPGIGHGGRRKTDGRFRPFLGPGEVGTIMVIAQDRRGARTISLRFRLAPPNTQ